MSGIEIVAALFCFALCVNMVAMAWWIFRISSSLARIRDADQVARETAARSILSWVVQTAEDVQALRRRYDALVEHLRGLCVLLDPSGARETIAIPPPPPLEKYPAKAPTAQPSAPTEANQQDRASDADTQCWQGPASSPTMLGVGIPQVSRPVPAPTPPPKRAKR